MIPKDVMEEAGSRLQEIPGLVTLPFAASKVSILPAALISLPPNGTYDLTYNRGMDTFRLEIFVLVSKNVDEAARDALSPFLAGSGNYSVRQTLDSKTNKWRSCDVFKVVSFNTARIKFSTGTGEITYLAAVFAADVSGRGGA